MANGKTPAPNSLMSLMHWHHFWWCQHAMRTSCMWQKTPRDKLGAPRQMKVSTWQPYTAARVARSADSVMSVPGTIFFIVFLVIPREDLCHFKVFSRSDITPSLLVDHHVPPTFGLLLVARLCQGIVIRVGRPCQGCGQVGLLPQCWSTGQWLTYQQKN